MKERKNMKGTPTVTTLSPRLYNKIMNQAKNETKHREEARNIERSYKYCGKRHLFIVSINTAVFFFYKETFNQPGYTATAVMFCDKIKDTRCIRDTPK